MLPKVWKESFVNGIIAPTKKNFVMYVKKERVINVTIRLTKTKKFEANLKILKRQTPNGFGHMRPNFQE